MSANHASAARAGSRVDLTSVVIRILHGSVRPTSAANAFPAGALQIVLPINGTLLLSAWATGRTMVPGSGRSAEAIAVIDPL
jgi:hypothetical protein